MENFNSNYSEGLWYINHEKNMACRYSNGHLTTVPATTEILEEIKRQIEAVKYLSAFQMIENNDENMIGYLNVILDDYVNYLDTDAIKLLITKMESLGKSGLLNIENSNFVNSLYEFLQLNKMEDFQDTLEQFQEYNASYFASILANQEGNARHF